MGAKDTATIKYMRQNEIFADAFNYFVYGGKQVISPDSLEELDTRELDVPYGGAFGEKQPVQRTRDVIKAVTTMTDNRIAYMVVAIEAQSNIHYAMPVKNMVYDALQYAKQVEKAVASHKISGDYKNVGSDEYLSGFMKKDHLMPVVTLVVYFDSKPWDGPMSLHEMFEYKNQEVLALVPDYKINLIAPAAIQDEDFEKFASTLKEVLAFIKYSKDTDKLEKIVNSDAGFQKLGRKEVDVLNSCVNANLEMKDNEEVLNMCEAIQGMMKKAADRERITTKLNDIQNLMRKMNLTVEQSMDILDVAESDREELNQLLVK